MLVTFRRIIKAGFVGFWRNAYVSMASVFVITIALFVIGVTMILDQLLTSTLAQLQSKVDINVYFMPEAPEADIQRIRTALDTMPEVASVTFTSREDALAQYRARNQNNTIALQALDELGENPLGASVAILAVDTSQYEGIARFLEEQQAKENPQTPVIDNFNYAKNQEAINKFTGIINAVEQGSFFTMIALIIVAVMITFNTIRLAIYTAREEISIMRLVGASNMFIRGPFLLQGAMYGVISAVIALAILYPALIWIGPAVINFFQFDALGYFVQNFATILLALVGMGVVLGLVSSLLAIRRYLNI